MVFVVSLQVAPCVSTCVRSRSAKGGRHRDTHQRHVQRHVVNNIFQSNEAKIHGNY